MSDIFLGLMSGTSVDGLDIALCRFKPQLEILATAENPFPSELRSRIDSACSNSPILLDDLLKLEQDYTEFCATSTSQFIRRHAADRQIRAIGFHGQTLRHRPDVGTSLQMANPSLLAEKTGIDVVADFRRRDLAAGGEGAPLVPAFHQYLTAALERPLGLLNLGGIANLTQFNVDGSVLGFDTGPANTLMDQWILKNRGKHFDANGEWAEAGCVDNALLGSLLSEPYFNRPAPKSTGRELFNLRWLETFLEQHNNLPQADIQRTLLELSAVSATQAITTPLKQLVLCGGGSRNRLLVDRISMLLPKTEVVISDQLGWPSEYLEAVAFAWLAQRHVDRESGNLHQVTGAKGPRILGALYPA